MNLLITIIAIIFKKQKALDFVTIESYWLVAGFSFQLCFPLLAHCFSPDTLYSEPLLDGHIVHYYELGELIPSTYSSEMSVGDGLDWDFYPISTRAYLSFSIDSLDYTSESIVSAILRVYQLHSTGDNSSDVFPSFSGHNYPCLIDHITYGDTLDTVDWTAGDNGDAQTLQSGFGTISDSPENGYKEINILENITNDINSGRSKSQYRLRFRVEHDDDMYNDWLCFSASTYPPAYFTPAIIIEYDATNSISFNDSNSSSVLEQFIVYPNPTNSMMNISFWTSDQQAVKLDIYDLKGHALHSETLLSGRSGGSAKNISIARDLSLISGLYFISLRSGNDVIVQKVSIIK
ncbi:MAG: T9SS type A sorting domain-containing protein [Candidatus Marinimicrobia bacterium]|nr:T9SS type A sorting domain-containing protein [FCB group bacterium]MBL7024273.1 T9SS type A sorting domain-containing protein [Candidatus Neomarinimicrobiota bacterium]